MQIYKIERNDKKQSARFRFRSLYNGIKGEWWSFEDEAKAEGELHKAIVMKLLGIEEEKPVDEELPLVKLLKAEGVYKVFKFNCVITSLSLDSNVNNFGQYSYTLQGTGPFTEITSVDTYTVSGGTITARDPLTYKLVAVGYGGKWYYNYTISAGPVINLGSSLNGTSVTAVYVTS